MAVFAQKFLETLLDLVNNAVLDESLKGKFELSASEVEGVTSARLERIAQRLFEITSGGDVFISDCPCGGRCKPTR